MIVTLIGLLAGLVPRRANHAAEIHAVDPLATSLGNWIVAVLRVTMPSKRYCRPARKIHARRALRTSGAQDGRPARKTKFRRVRRRAGG